MSKRSSWFGNDKPKRKRRRRKCGRSSSDSAWFGKGSRRGRGGAESVGAEAFSGKM